MDDQTVVISAKTMHGEDFVAYLDDESDLVFQFEMYDSDHGVIPYTHYFDSLTARKLLTELGALVARQIRADTDDPIAPVPAPDGGRTQQMRMVA